MFYIRADANDIIATGHVMRCLTIVDEIHSMGEQVVFITADHLADLLIHERGYETICLDSKWDDMEKEIARLKPIIKKEKITKILVDSYYATDTYLTQLSADTKIIYMDDLGVVNAPVDMLINYNIYSEDLNYSHLVKKYRTKLILGTKYVPLRAEFKDNKIFFKEQVKKIFISTGGIDIYNIAGKLIKEIEKRKDFMDIEFHVICGSMNKNLPLLKEESQNSNHIILHNNVKEISAIMCQCDLAISACGFTMYELCACGLPIITFSFADNQLFGVKGFSNKGIAVSCGDCRNNIEKMISEILNEVTNLIKNKEKRYEMYKKEQTAVDGNGGMRLAHSLLSD